MAVLILMSANLDVAAQDASTSSPSYTKAFTEANLKDWTTVSGIWDLVQDGGKTYIHCSPAEGPARIVVGDKEWTDYSVEVTSRVDKWLSDKAGDYGLIVRYVGPGDYYLFLYDNNPAAKALIIQKKVGGKLITLASQPFDYETGHSYTFKGIVIGNTLEFDVDGKKMVTATAAEIPKGPAGLLAWQTDIKFDGFEVTAAGK